MVDTGYIYLTVDEFCAGALVHLISGIDQECHLAGGAGAVATAITGYTEWVSADAPLVTIGWDWPRATWCGCNASVRPAAM
jgi:hypothetical protein